MFRFITLLLVLSVVAPAASGADLKRGKFLFQTCAACHGDKGEGKTVGTLKLPPIGGLPAWYAEIQLKNFKNGVRGAHPSDTKGLLMRPMARLLPTDKDVKAMAAFIETLPQSRDWAKVEGNKENGKYYYDNICLSCHGDKFQGNPDPTVQAPSHKALADWYMMEQLKKFISGVRGAHPKDAGGAKMRPIVADILPQLAESKKSTTEQALKDVVSYIYSERYK